MNDDNKMCFIIKENEEGKQYIERENLERNIKVNLFFENDNKNEVIKEITQIMTKMYVDKIINN